MGRPTSYMSFDLLGDHEDHLPLVNASAPGLRHEHAGKPGDDLEGILVETVEVVKQAHRLAGGHDLAAVDHLG